MMTKYKINKNQHLKILIFKKSQQKKINQTIMKIKVYLDRKAHYLEQINQIYLEIIK